MKWFLTLGAALLPAFAAAANYPDISQHIDPSSRLFTEHDKVETSLLQGDSFSQNMWFWQGAINGHDVSIYAGQKRVQLQSRNDIKKVLLSNAISAAQDKFYKAGLDLRGMDFYLHEAKKEQDSAICISSLEPGASSDIPYAQVYLITNPMKKPQIYKLPSFLASCLSITKDSSGNVYLPMVNSTAEKTEQNLDIQFYKVIGGKLGKATSLPKANSASQPKDL